MCFCTFANAERNVLLLLEGHARCQKILLLWSGDVEKIPGPVAIAAAINETKIKKNKLLTAIHVNARSPLRHHNDLERSHILAVSETWLDSSVFNSEIHLAGYNHSGGGVAVYCCDYLPCTLLHCATSSSGVESLWVSVFPPLSCL